MEDTLLHEKKYESYINETVDMQETRRDSVNDILEEIIRDSFKNGYIKGIEDGAQQENEAVRRQIVINLINNTHLSDDEIYEIAGFDDVAWRDIIYKYRKNYENKVTESNKLEEKKDLLTRAYTIIYEKFGDRSGNIPAILKNMSNESLLELIKDKEFVDYPYSYLVELARNSRSVEEEKLYMAIADLVLNIPE